jgi:hypothetical protein
MIQANQAKGLSVLAVVTTLLAGASFLIRGSQAAVAALVVWAGLQSMAAFYALLWALPRSNRDFFAVFVGDALLRVVTLGVATTSLYLLKVPFTVPLLTLAMTYLVLSLIQIPFFLQVP